MVNQSYPPLPPVIDARNKVRLEQRGCEWWYQILTSFGTAVTDWQYGGQTKQDALIGASCRFGDVRYVE